MGLGRRQHGVQGDLQIAVGAVLEADRTGQTAGQFAVGLALGGARADGAPGNQVTEVLRRDRVERLGAAGQAEVVDVDEQAARQAQTFFDVKRVVHARVVDQALPAHRGTGLLEVHPHHDEELIGQLVGQSLEALRVVHGSGDVVDRARPDHNKQTGIATAQHVSQGAARGTDGLGSADRGWDVFVQLGG